MAEADLDLALRAVERQAAAMQEIERKIAELYKRRSSGLPATAPPNCEAAPSGFAREILSRTDRDKILTQMEKAHA